MEPLRKAGSAPIRVLVLAALGLPLGACVHDPVATGSIEPVDYRQRHPIVLTDAPRHLDVFVGRAHGGLEPRQRQDVHAFAAEYRRTGKGTISAIVPQGAAPRWAVERTLGAVRQALAEAGVPHGALVVVAYHPDDPALAAPIRLSFARLQAKVASQCGLWPVDLAGGDSVEGWKNRQYWNFGCATQANLAAQIADPIDLVRSRAEVPGDTRKRLNGIEKLRKGEDPSTNWKTEVTKINQSVGN